MSDIRKAQDVIDAALRSEVALLLAQCTEKQGEMFKRVFPAGLDSLDESELRTAFALCERTVRKNSAEGGEWPMMMHSP